MVISCRYKCVVLHLVHFSSVQCFQHSHESVIYLYSQFASIFEPFTIQIPHIGDKDGICKLAGDVFNFLSNQGVLRGSQYAKCLGHLISASSITEKDRKRSVFLAIIGPKAYKRKPGGTEQTGG